MGHYIDRCINFMHASQKVVSSCHIKFSISIRLGRGGGEGFLLEGGEIFLRKSTLGRGGGGVFP